MDGWEWVRQWCWPSWQHHRVCQQWYLYRDTIRGERLNQRRRWDGEFVSTSDVCAVTVAISVGGVGGIGAPLASALKLDVAALNTTGNTHIETFRLMVWRWLIKSSSKDVMLMKRQSKLLTCQPRRHQCPRHWHYIRTGHQQVQAGAHSIWPNSREGYLKSVIINPSLCITIRSLTKHIGAKKENYFTQMTSFWVVHSASDSTEAFTIWCSSMKSTWW